MKFQKANQQPPLIIRVDSPPRQRFDPGKDFEILIRYPYLGKTIQLREELLSTSLDIPKGKPVE